MSFQAYLDNIKAKTGKTPQDFATLAAQKGLSQHGELVAWLKQDFGLGHGHANAIVAVLLKSESRKASPDKKLDKLFSGKKVAMRDTYDKLIAAIHKLGPDIEASANETYVNVVRKKKFAIIQPTAERLDVGIKLKGIEAAGRLEAAGSWNAMVSHRVRISEPKEIDKELLGWLNHAYNAA